MGSAADAPVALPEAPPVGAAAGEEITPPPPAVASWRRQSLLEKDTVVLRAVGCLFSALAFLVMVTNKHGDWKEFEKYEEYRYAVAISAVGFLYTAAQLARRILRGDNWDGLLPRRAAAAAVDFAGDQLIAYLLISALSAAIPITNRMREGADNIFTDASAASISMAFFAFAALALSAMVSGFKLSRHAYI
ncbi:unnamed protein product [Spirodela intermedia]|uniref:CASP-like protein n=1 Tax=Spirodela intermedia TaxID=51605 RepID=A0A7I8K7F7_SPIIN|nr:unnamed protein product [Spirodela intermedia]